MARTARIPADHKPDTPLRLDIAAQIAFPDGSMGAPGLRKERDRGRLVTEIIAGKEYVTLAEIERMRELCRVHRKAPDLSGARKAAKQMAASGAKPDGLSKTAESDPAQALAVMTAMKLKNASPPTSQRSTHQLGSATVTPIRSR